MHAKSLFKNGRHVGLIQVLGIRLSLIWASHKICSVLMSFPHSRLTVNAKVSYVTYQFSYITRDVNYSVRTISTTLPDKTSQQIITLSSVLLKKHCHIYSKESYVISFSAGYVFHSSSILSIVVKEQKQFGPTHFAFFSSPLWTAWTSKRIFPFVEQTRTSVKASSH